MHDWQSQGEGGEAVGVLVGRPEGACVGTALGETVGLIVGAEVGRNEGPVVGGAVESQDSGLHPPHSEGNSLPTVLQAASSDSDPPADDCSQSMRDWQE